MWTRFSEWTMYIQFYYLKYFVLPTELSVCHSACMLVPFLGLHTLPDIQHNWIPFNKVVNCPLCTSMQSFPCTRTSFLLSFGTVSSLMLNINKDIPSTIWGAELSSPVPIRWFIPIHLWWTGCRWMRFTSCFFSWGGIVEKNRLDWFVALFTVLYLSVILQVFH